MGGVTVGRAASDGAFVEEMPARSAPKEGRSLVLPYRNETRDETRPTRAGAWCILFEHPDTSGKVVGTSYS